jgi:hypothetical protein
MIDEQQSLHIPSIISPLLLYYIHLKITPRQKGGGGKKRGERKRNTKYQIPLRYAILLFPQS